MDAEDPARTGVERIPAFQEHDRELDGNRHVYAVVSRRAGGLSIGVNLSPDKRCSFACRYCQVDRGAPVDASAVDVDRIITELVSVLALHRSGSVWDRAPFDTTPPRLRRLADVAFAGDGEPTMAAAFPAAALRVRQLCDSVGLEVPLRLLTNATQFDRRAVRQALVHFDELWCKLDAGTPARFRFVAGSPFPFARVLANLLAVARERPIVLQSLFFKYRGAHPSERELAAYLGRLEAIRARGGSIARVQVYTVARRPADPEVGALDLHELAAIAARVAAGGFAVEAYP